MRRKHAVTMLAVAGGIAHEPWFTTDSGYYAPTASINGLRSYLGGTRVPPAGDPQLPQLFSGSRSEAREVCGLAAHRHHPKPTEGS